MSLAPINISKVAGKLEASTALVPVASLGYLGISVYVCQGEVEWHRHPDEDEMFLVHEGILTLETELGNQILHAEEIAVVPKGIAHRSSSPLRTVSVLIRPEVLTTRTNGHRRAGLSGEEPRLEKVRLSRLRPLLSLPYHPVPVSKLATFQLFLDLAVGDSPAQLAPRGGLMLYSLRGMLRVQFSDTATDLHDGELCVVPAGTLFKLLASEATVYLSMSEER